jgi:hypothetical protein
MTRRLILLAGIALAACGPAAQPEGNATSAANMVEPVADKCTPPELALAGGAELESALLGEAKANFVTAFQRACDKDLLKDKPLIDPKAADQARIFLINAPEANVASIYLSDVDGSRTVLEYPFLTTDGKSQVPSADELEEAIYCAVIGATPEEQESTGRCLVD